MNVDFDAVVVGAGVVGLAVARELSGRGRTVLVLEKAARVGTDTSSRNSEVIHAGIYYPQGSLKARLCVEGRNLLYDYCASHGVATQRIGKLIIATSAQEETKLQAIANTAKANGVTDLQWLSKAEVAEREPEIRCTKALLSPSTGIVDATGFMLALQGEAESRGTVFAFNAEVTAVKREVGIFIVSAMDANAGITEISCRQLINCAGHGAHAVAQSIQGYDRRHLPPRYLAKGNYCSVSGRSPFKHLVYPVPVSGALGIHATLDLVGATRFGPDIHWVNDFDYSLSPDLPEKFMAAVAAYWPEVQSRTLTPSYCGIRPKIHGPNEGFADFRIQQREEHGISGLTNLFGIESPGLTASLAIAALVCSSQS